MKYSILLLLFILPFQLSANPPDPGQSPDQELAQEKQSQQGMIESLGRLNPFSQDFGKKKDPNSPLTGTESFAMMWRHSKILTSNWVRVLWLNIWTSLIYIG